MKRLTLLAAALWAVSAQAQVSCTQIGNFTSCSDGTSFNRIGNSVYGSDGSSAQRIGNSTFINEAPAQRQWPQPNFNPYAPPQPFMQRPFQAQVPRCSVNIWGQTICQ